MTDVKIEIFTRFSHTSLLRFLNRTNAPISERAKRRNITGIKSVKTAQAVIATILNGARKAKFLNLSLRSNTYNARNRGDQCYVHYVRNWERSDPHKMCIALGVPRRPEGPEHPACVCYVVDEAL